MPRTSHHPTSVCRRLPAVVLVSGLALAALAACGNTTGPLGANPDATQTAVDQNPGAFLPPTSAPSTQAASPTDSSTPSAGASSSGASSAGASSSGAASAGASNVAAAKAGLPAVSHATDLAVAPVVAVGKGTPSAKLLTRDLVLGSGTAATAADSVDVRYVGSIYATGKVFDASWTRSPSDSVFALDAVIPGFAEGIVGMKPGGRREIAIPPAQGYGSAGSPPSISGTDTLVFVVDFLKVSATS